MTPGDSGSIRRQPCDRALPGPVLKLMEVVTIRADIAPILWKPAAWADERPLRCLRLADAPGASDDEPGCARPTRN